MGQGYDDCFAAVIYGPRCKSFTFIGEYFCCDVKGGAEGTDHGTDRRYIRWGGPSTTVGIIAIKIRDWS